METEGGNPADGTGELTESVGEDSEGLGGEAGLNSWNCYLSGHGNSAYGINHRTTNNTLLPVIAGSAFFNNSGYPQLPQPYFQVGGSWLWPDTGNFRPVGDAWAGGLMRDVDSGNNLVGTLNNRACYVPAATGTPVLLPGLSPNRPAGAFALSESAQVAGWAQLTNQSFPGGLSRAVRWDLLAPITVVDLDTAEPGRPGFAYGINAPGVTVGKVQRTKNHVHVWRAFRWNGTLTELALPRDTNSVTLYHNVANAVTASGHALGATDAVIWRGYYTNQTRACVWWGLSNAPVTLGTVGWTDPNPWYRPGRSEALGAVELSPNRLVVVGTGWLTPTGFSRAFRQEVSREQPGKPWNYGVMLDLNDPQLAVVFPGWTLVTAEDVNGAEWIVGLATDASGQGRGYVLVPQGYVSQ